MDNFGLQILPLVFLFVNIAIIGVIAYFIIKKAVKDGICEAVDKLKKTDELTKL